MRITIPSDIQAALARQARKQGTSPEDLVLTALRQRFAPQSARVDSADSLADFLAGHLGVLSSSEFVAGGANMSDNCGSKFPDGLTEKRKLGRL